MATSLNDTFANDIPITIFIPTDVWLKISLRREIILQKRNLGI
jgi:hypothetical protein